MHRCVIQLYYRLFYYLEQQGLLDPVNDLHLLALHHIYLSRINTSLTAFKDGWSLRTEKNLSPLQLFTAGALKLQNSGLEAMDFFQDVDDHYGVDYSEEQSNDEDLEVGYPHMLLP